MLIISMPYIRIANPAKIVPAAFFLLFFANNTNETPIAATTDENDDGLSILTKILSLSIPTSVNNHEVILKQIHNINFEMESRTPLTCRENPKFSKYFNLMWKELDEKKH